MRNKLRKTLCIALAVLMAVSLLVLPVSAASDFEYTEPTEAMAVNPNVLTTLTQRAASEIPLVFGINVMGGNFFNGLKEVGGHAVNENPDPYIWNFNYLTNTEGSRIQGATTYITVNGEEVTVDDSNYSIIATEALPVGTYYRPLGNGVTNPNGLYGSGGHNQAFVTAIDEMGGVGYAVGLRSDVILSFNSALLSQIDFVNGLREGDEFYQAGDEDYSPLLIDIPGGTVTGRMYSWVDMGRALKNYLALNPDKTTRYGDPYVTAVNLEEFSAGIPYYIASLIASGKLEKKTLAYVSSIDGATLICSEPSSLSNVYADMYAEVNNFNYITGSYTLTELMARNADVIVLGSNGYGYAGNAATQVGTSASTAETKLTLMQELASLGYTPGDMPIIIDSTTSQVTVGTNGFNYAPQTCLFVPYAQAYCYMDSLAEVNPAINPVAMFKYMVDEFFHVADDSVSDVAMYYIGSKWDSVDPDYDTVPADFANYETYDKSAIASAVQEGIRYALSPAAAANGNVLIASYSAADEAYKMLTSTATTALPPEGHEYITLKTQGATKYLDLTKLIETEAEAGTGAIVDGMYSETVRSYKAIIDYYESGDFGYGASLKDVLQRYADRMVPHVWKPDTTVAGTYGYGLSAGSGYTAKDNSTPAFGFCVTTDQNVAYNGAPATVQFYNIDDYTYYKLRDMAALLDGSANGFGITFDPETLTVYANTGVDYTKVGTELQSGADKSASCVPSAWKLFVNNQLINCNIYNIGGENYFKLADLGNALGFGYSYDAAAKTVQITAAEKPASTGNQGGGQGQGGQGGGRGGRG